MSNAIRSTLVTIRTRIQSLPVPAKYGIYLYGGSVIASNFVFAYNTGTDALDSFRRKTAANVAKYGRLNTEVVFIGDSKVYSEYEAVRAGLKDESFANAFKSILWPAHIAEGIIVNLVMALNKPDEKK